MKFISSIFFSFLATHAFAAFTPANRPYDVEKYSLKYVLDPAQDLKEFEGSVKIEAIGTAELTQIDLDRENLTITKFELDKGRKASSEDSNPAIYSLKLIKPIKKGEKFSLTLTFKGKINETHRGFFKVKDPDAPERGFLYYTHFEPLSARAFFPCNDEPYDKAIVELAVTLPEGYDAFSNGKRLSDKPVKKDKAPWHEVKWLQEKPHSTYLVSLAVGKFKTLEGGKKEMPITISANEKKLERAKYTLEVTQRSLQAFEAYLGTPYPWNKYSTIGLPTFLWGGMENTSSTHMNEDRMLLNDPNSSMEKVGIAGLAAHELAHQWFGNYVTLKWWNDVWLNEAFATYLTLVAEKAIFPNERPELDFVAETWDGYFKQEDGPRSHPIVQANIDTPDDGFDSISYTKGANVLRMLSYYLGEERFKKSLRFFLKQFGSSNATYIDFFKSVERTTGDDLAAFRDSWLLQKGYPIINYSGNYDAKTHKYALTIKQRSNHPGDKTKFRFRLPVAFRRKAAPAFDKTISITVGDFQRTELVELPAEPELISVNPGGVVLAKVSAEGMNEKELATYALGDPDPVIRYWAARSMAEGLTTGKSLSSFIEKSLTYVLQADTSPYVRISLLRFFQKLPNQELPSKIGESIVRLAKESQLPAFEASAPFIKDSLGWRKYRSVLLGTLGVVNDSDANELLEKTLAQVSLSLDDLSEASRAVAQMGSSASLETLKTALKLHGARGYRYQYNIQLAFASLRDTRVVPELSNILSKASPDLVGRLGRAISDNPPVRKSAEWASVLGDFLVKDARLGDEVKARVLTSVESEKSEHVKQMLETVLKNSTSERIKGLTRNILDKANGAIAVSK